MFFLTQPLPYSLPIPPHIHLPHALFLSRSWQSRCEERVARGQGSGGGTDEVSFDDGGNEMTLVASRCISLTTFLSVLELETAGRGTGRLSSSALPQLIGCDGSSEIRALSGGSAKMLAGLLELDAAQRRKRVFHQMMMNLRFAVQVRGEEERERGERGAGESRRGER